MTAEPGGRPRFEVADIVRLHGEEYRRAHSPTAAQESALRHIAACRTAAMGGHVDACDGCGGTRVSYNSCRDRHCPKCQSMARADWLEARLERLLPTSYFHVVFTIPDEINALALGNRRVLFDLLFASAAATLRAIAGDEKHLGAEIGVTAVLHTWGQNLLFHPHLHCVVTGGGLTRSGDRWVSTRERYFLPVKVLSRLFRGKFLAGLKSARAAGELRFGGSADALGEEPDWKAFLASLYRKDWVVYAKPPFGGPEQVFKYLGRYTHRVAISNHRITNIERGRVTFTLKNYADAGKRTTMVVSAPEFLRRFALHVLPRGFTRIRHFGLMAGCNVATKLETARRLLQGQAAVRESTEEGARPLSWWERLRERTGIDVMACTSCGGRLTRMMKIGPL